MRYKGDGYHSRAWVIDDAPKTKIFDLAEQLMCAETNEGLVSNILTLYQAIGEQLWEEDMSQSQQYPSYPASGDTQGFMVDKLIELSYIIHREKWRKSRVGCYKQSWASQALQNDDLDFEQYLMSLQS